MNLKHVMIEAAALVSCALSLTASSGAPGTRPSVGSGSDYDNGVPVRQTGSGAKLSQGTQLNRRRHDRSRGINGRQAKIVAGDAKSSPHQTLRKEEGALTRRRQARSPPLTQTSTFSIAGAFLPPNSDPIQTGCARELASRAATS